MKESARRQTFKAVEKYYEGVKSSDGGPFELGGKELTVVPTCFVESLPPTGFTSSGAGTKITGSTSRGFDGQVL